MSLGNCFTEESDFSLAGSLPCLLGHFKTLSSGSHGKEQGQAARHKLMKLRRTEVLAHMELNPTNRQVSELERGLFPGEPCNDCSLERDTQVRGETVTEIMIYFEVIKHWLYSDKEYMLMN